MYPGLYDEERAAQAVAYFLHRAGGSLELLKLTKLTYFAERLSYERYGEPLTGDNLASLQHGPILSHTYNRVKVAQVRAGWDKWVAGRFGNEIRQAHALNDPEEELLALSRADLEILEETWGRFGSMSASEIRNYSHAKCPEWEDPGTSSDPIEADALFAALGMDEAEITERKQYLRQIGHLNKTVGTR